MAFRSTIWLAALLSAAFAPSAPASDTPRAVVELFTSQGCSSCPPADRVLAEFARERDVVALTLPVDYWDYLGWKDTLASPVFSARQRAYGYVRGDRQVFTPQMVVNGGPVCIGSDREQVEEKIVEASTGDRLPVAIRLAEEGAMLTIAVAGQDGRPDVPAAAEVWVLPVMREREVTITKGENRGKLMRYVNVVRSLLRIGSWSGAPARYEIPLATARPPEADSYVVLLQETRGVKPGRILGAAKGPGL